MDIKQGIALSGMIILFTVPWFVVGLYYWGWLFVAITLCVITAEIISTIRKKKTISQQFWEYLAHNKKGAIIVLICLVSSFVVLILHLLHLP